MVVPVHRLEPPEQSLVAVEESERPHVVGTGGNRPPKPPVRLRSADLEKNGEAIRLCANIPTG